MVLVAVVMMVGAMAVMIPKGTVRILVTVRRRKGLKVQKNMMVSTLLTVTTIVTILPEIMTTITASLVMAKIMMIR